MIWGRILENAIYSISAGYPAWPIAMWILHYETRPRWDAVRQSDISGWWGSTATGNKKAIKLLHRTDPRALFHQLRVTHSVSSIKGENRRLDMLPLWPQPSDVTNIPSFASDLFAQCCSWLVPQLVAVQEHQPSVLLPGFHPFTSGTLTRQGSVSLLQSLNPWDFQILFCVFWFEDFRTQHARNVPW